MDGHDGNGSFDRGTYWYAKTFATPKQAFGGNRVFVEILAAGQQATVYVNGTEVVYHEGGYSTFRADVTDLCKEDGENLLVVACSNERKRACIRSLQTSRLRRAVPRREHHQRAGRAFRSGILRRSGIQVTPTPCDCGGAMFDIVTYTKGSDEKFTVLYSICDAEGQEVAGGCRPADDTKIKLFVPDAKKWEIDDPYL